MIRRSRFFAATITLSGIVLTAVAASGPAALAASPPSTDPPTTASSPPEDGPASADALSEAGEQSSAAAYRIEMFMEMSAMGLTIDGDAPLMTGEYANGRSHMVMDFAGIFENLIPADEMPPEMRGRDLTMEFVTDGTDMYIRAPFFAAMADQADDDSLAVFGDIGDGWGYVDGSDIPGMDASAVTGVMGVGGADPSAFFDLLADVEGAEEIGTEEIRGVTTTGVRAEVNLADLMAAQGGTAALPESATALADATLPIEVWVDGEGFVRRITFDLTGEAIADAAQSAGEAIPPTVLAGMEMSMTMEMFDYGAADIEIDVPTEFVDITDDFLELIPQSG